MYEKLKKKYGQNFLIDKNIIKKISNLIPKKSSNIIEIGPGDGRLTEYILNLEPNELRLIEIDADLIPILHSKFNKFKNVKIINDNMMKYEVKGKIDLIIFKSHFNVPKRICSTING